MKASEWVPAPSYGRRTGRTIVELVNTDTKPSDILTRDAFLNAIRVNSALGGSTNAPIHLNAIARHAGVELTLEDWERHGHDVPLLVNLQPAGEYLGEDFYRAGGVPAVVGELMRAGLIHGDALTVNGRTIGESCAGVTCPIRAIPMLSRARSWCSMVRRTITRASMTRRSVSTSARFS